MKTPIQKLLAIGQHPEDSEEDRLKKSGFIVVALLAIGSTIVWGLFSLINGLVIPFLVITSGSLLWSINIAVFSFSKKFNVFANIQLTLLLIIGFATQTSMGGFIPSGATIMWAMIGPAGALIFQGIRRALFWFAGYVALVLVAYFIDDYLPAFIDHNVSNDFILTMFALNTIGIATLIFMSQSFFVRKINELNRHIEDKNVELQKQSEQLREMDEVKSRFFANISHEFRTPLTLILGLINKLKAQPNKVPEVKDTDNIKRNASRLLQLINQLLDLSKLESGGMKLQVTKSDIALFAKNITAQFESMSAQKNVKLLFNGIEVSQSSSLDQIELYFDHEKLQKILTNLLSNAMKFTPRHGGVSVEVEKTKSKDEHSELALIKVINSGEEIPSDKLPLVFDRFFQVDAASNRKHEGTGIGLALVKELVELHHGEVSVESKMKKTTFTIRLPINTDYLSDDEMLNASPVEITMEPIVESFEIEEEQNINHGKDRPSQLEILVVEDNTDLRIFIKGILQQDYKIIEAVDGIDGFEKAESSIPDLIVSDVMMPRMNGFELCKKLKTNEKTNHIPVILLTAKATRENKLEGLETGADDYLVKPFDEVELKVRIKNLIAIREKLQKKYQQESYIKPIAARVTSVQQQFLEKIKTIVEEHIDNDQFNVEDLGDKMFMSRSQIHRKLKALTNQSATQFIRNYRLHRAADLIKQDSGNITEIAYQVGFSSQTYFSKCFQELFKCSPSEYKDN